MKPVDQTRFGKEGNCLMASVASLLEISLEECPNIYDLCEGDEKRIERDWWKILTDFLHRHGYYPALIDARHGDPKGYALAGGKSNRGLWHSVVALDGEIVHDPHPSRVGLEFCEDYIVLIPIKVSEVRQ